MKPNQRTPCILLVLAFLACAMPVHAIDSQQAQQDWKNLDDLMWTYAGFEGIRFLPNWTHEPARLKTTVVQDHYLRWNQFKNHLTTLVEKFHAEYGQTPEAVAATLSGVSPPLGAKNKDIGDLYAEAAEAVEQLPETETGFAEKLTRAGEEMANLLSHMQREHLENPLLPLERSQATLGFFRLARQYDSDAAVDGYIDQARALVAQEEEAARGLLEHVEWPGHHPNFSRNGDELAAAAIEYLEANPDWSAPEYDDVHTPVAAAVVADGWGVQKRSLSGPTQYRLRMFVAFRGDKDPEVAYGYYMYFYPPESADPRQAPPFVHANSEQYATRKLLLSKVPRN